ARQLRPSPLLSSKLPMQTALSGTPPPESGLLLRRERVLCAALEYAKLQSTVAHQLGVRGALASARHFSPGLAVPVEGLSAEGGFPPQALNHRSATRAPRWKLGGRSWGRRIVLHDTVSRDYLPRHSFRKTAAHARG